MKNLMMEIRTALVATLLFGVVCSGLYPGLVYAAAQLLFPDQANGSLITDEEGGVLGSRLLGQPFRGAGYFHPRPSAAGRGGYDGTASGGANLGPGSRTLQDLVRERVIEYRRVNGLGAEVLIPADAVTASGSGLDPHISLRNAGLQLARVARHRGVGEEEVRALIGSHVEGGRMPGFLGEAGVNVLRLNLALDELARKRSPAGGGGLQGGDGVNP